MGVLFSGSMESARRRAKSLLRCHGLYRHARRTQFRKWACYFPARWKVPGGGRNH